MYTPLNKENEAVKGKKKNKVGFPKGRQVLPKARDEISELLNSGSKGREFLIENLHLIQDRYNQVMRAVCFEPLFLEVIRY